MRQLVGRVLRIGTEMFVFLVATLLVATAPVWAEQTRVRRHCRFHRKF